MKRNRIAIIIVVVLGAASLWFVINHGNGTIKKTLRDFAVADTASITKIFLADKDGNTITLERQPASQWLLNGKYIARPDAIQTLLYTINKIDVKEPVGKAAQDNVIKRLASNAIKCEIYQNNQLSKAYYIGTETTDQSGTYMILIDIETMKPSAKAFVTYIPGFEGYLTSRYFTEERGWRDRTVFQYIPSDIKSVKMEAPSNPEQSYELTIAGTNDYQLKLLAGNKTLHTIDTMAVKQYLSYFQQLNYESFEIDLKQNQIDSVLKTQPLNILTVTDNKGQTSKVTFFARPNLKKEYGEDGKLLPFDPTRMDALMDNGKDFVMIQYYVFGKVLPPVDYFLRKSGSAKPNS